MSIKLFAIACLLAVAQAQLIDIERSQVISRIFSKKYATSDLLDVSHARFTNLKRTYGSSRMIGGEDAKPGEFPHQVSLQIRTPENDTHYCGGSILDERWILTSVICTQYFTLNKIFNKDASLVVKAGINNLNITESNDQAVLMDTFFVQDNYTGFLDLSPFDVALIKLSSPLKLNKFVAPIKLPKKDSEPAGRVIMSGWGVIKDDPKEGQEMSNILQKAHLDLIDRTSCKRAIVKLSGELGEQLNENVIGETNVCSGPLISGLGACMGDYGGPLISQNENGNMELVGVVSWKLGPCSHKESPTVHVRVSSFIDWIEYIMSKN